jgi:hypothetical protein
VGEVALRQVFSEYFGFPCQLSFHRLLHTHLLSSEAGTIGQLLADVPSGLSLTPPQKQVKEDEMGRACSTQRGRSGMYIRLRRESQKERDHQEDVDVDVGGGYQDGS